MGGIGEALAMRILHAAATAAILGAALALCACASQMGTAAGDVVGGTAWVVTKTGSLAWKGGTIAVQTTGRAAVGAARGVHQEFSGDKAAESAALSSDSADLTNRIKDPGAERAASLSQRQGASLPD
jgi:hypothetical protein